MSSIIGRIYNGSVIQYGRSCTPSRSIGLYFWGVRGSWAEWHFLFSLVTNCVIDKSLTLGRLWPLVFVLNNTLILGIWCSTIPHLPGCFCPWTYFENIGFNMVLTDPFMSHLATQLRYSAGMFQALRLVSWISHFPPACWSTFWKSNFKQQLGCRFDVMFYIFFVFWHMQLYMSWYIRSIFDFTFLNIIYFFKYSYTSIFHRLSLYTFYGVVYLRNMILYLTPHIKRLCDIICQIRPM